MHPHMKKVVMMTAVSLGIIIVAFMVPVFVVPVALGVSEAASCTDYGCANAMFTGCGGFAQGDSTDFMGSWTRGMEGMLCMIGLDTGVSLNAFTINKV